MGAPLTDLTGKRVGKLIVVSRASNVGHRARWKCRCDCGTEKIIWACNLLTKASKSCGCGRSKALSKNPTWTGFGELGGKQFWEIKDGALRRNIPFEITIQYLWELFVKQSGKCALSGLPICLLYIKNNKMTCTASLDRIDNNGGYVNGNVQWVHVDVNFMKQDLPQNDFIHYCKCIANNTNI